MTGFSEDTHASYGATMDKRAFLTWVQGQDGRYEFDNGRVVMQARVTRAHSRVGNTIVRLLNERLDLDKWEAHTESFGIDVGNSVRYPDVMVEALSSGEDDLVTDAPVLLVEVLSPSSVGTDMTVKAAEYLTLPSLQLYIVASQDEPICWVWQRDQATGTFAKLPSEISGREASIEIVFFGIELPLGEIYARIGI